MYVVLRCSVSKYTYVTRFWHAFGIRDYGYSDFWRDSFKYSVYLTEAELMNVLFQLGFWV